MRHVTMALSIWCLLAASAYCQYDYEPGKISVLFKNEVTEERATEFIRRFGLDIIEKGNFGPPSIHFVVESGVDSFVKDIKRETIVESAEKGEKLKINEKEGTVVRAHFRREAGTKQIDDLSAEYRQREGIIAWRFYRRGQPFMVVKVPERKEQGWVDVLNKLEYESLIDDASLIAVYKSIRD